MNKICRLCGQEFEPIKYGGSRQFCFECVPEGLSVGERTKMKRQAAKRAGVKLLGGKCLKCGDTRPYLLSFHHLDKNDKDNTPSRYIANSQFEQFFDEIKKCCLLCNNCHAEFHYFEANENLTIEQYLEMTKEEIIGKIEQSEINRKYKKISEYNTGS